MNVQVAPAIASTDSAAKNLRLRGYLYIICAEIQHLFDIIIIISIQCIETHLLAAEIRECLFSC